ncbi:MAG: hydrogenase expression/formation protein HypE [Elusimicrobiota bacterium]
MKKTSYQSPVTSHYNITLAHGSGGRLTHELISSLFRKYFSNPALNAMDDAAELKLAAKENRLAFTTDSFVVDPIFFPGGDIGKLAVCGTVNDLAMKGARPIAISIAAIIEEGFSISALEKITESAAKAAKEAGVNIVTGDTKVVEKGKADRIFLTTSGVGIIEAGVNISGRNARPGDAVLISGTIGDHGIAVLSARNEFKLKSAVKSDCAPLNRLANRITSTCRNIHVMRDPTRGGLATTLNEIASASGCGIIIDEKMIPVKREVRAACNILGFDPLYVANEGKLIAILPENRSRKTLFAMRKDTYGKGSAVIGKVVNLPKGVWIKTAAGGMRPVVMLEGEQLPRIC